MSTILFNNIVKVLSVSPEEFVSADGDEIIRIVPTGRFQRYKKRSIIRSRFASTGKAVRNPAIYTLNGFIRFIASNLVETSGLHIIGDAYKLAMFEEAVEKADLEYYRIADEHLALPIIEQLASIINGLKKDGVSPHSLRKDFLSIDRFDNPLRKKQVADIVTIYELYESFFTEKIVDEVSLTQRVTDALLQQNNEQLQNLISDKVILIEGFTEFSQPETQFLSALAKHRLPIIIALEYSPDNGPLFGNLHETIQTLQREGFTLQKSAEDNEHSTVSDETSMGSCLRRWLFNTEKQIHNESFSNNVSLFRCRTRVNEVETIGRLVKHLIIQQGINAGDITIATRQPEIYSELFREVFRKFSIPVNITDRYVLSKAPVVSALFSVADIALRGWRVKDIRKALASPYLHFFLEQGKSEEETILTQRSSSANIQECAHLLRIADTRRFPSSEQWIQQIERRILATKDLLKVWTSSGIGDETEIEQRNTEIEKLERCKKDILLLSSLISIRNEVLTPDEFRSVILNNILQKLQVHKAIEQLYFHIAEKRNTLSSAEYLMLEEEVERDARALGTFIDVVNEFCYVQQQRFNNKKRSIIQYFTRLKSAVHAARYQIREKHGFGLTITSPEQTRKIPSEISILCGLIDGEFPEVYKPEQFLGIELPDSEERKIRSERMQFYEWIANALAHNNSAQVYLFYPESDGNNEVIPSPFIDSLLRITTLQTSGKHFSFAPKNGEQSMPSWAQSIASYQEASIHGLIKKTETEIKKELTENVLNRLQKKTSSPVSVTALEQYGECGFKYFSGNVLQLKSVKKVRSWFDSPDIGTLFHTIVYRFYSSLQKATTTIILKPENVEEYRLSLVEIAKQELERVHFDHPYYSIEVARLLGDSISDGLLMTWLDNELEKIELGWDFHPYFVELAFGQLGKKSTVLPAISVHENVLLRGKIDRVEIREHEHTIEYIIADYKTGMTPSKKDISSGRSLQIPLYIKATQEILQSTFDKPITIMAGVYYTPFATDDNRYVTIPLFTQNGEHLAKAGGYKIIKPMSDIEIEDLLEHSGTVAQNHLFNISKAYFPVLPLVSACNKCSYHSVCRIAELQNVQEDQSANEASNI